MKKTKIVNKSGFILVETLIVGVFIMGIFSLLYTNFFPLIGEYERYKDYDTVESAYVAHWGRMVALKGLTDSSYNTAKNTGYIEILGAGMVHPNVLRLNGFDDSKYQGFAFGIGIDRVAMLKYNIDDIKRFYTNDIRFLSEFYKE